MMFRLYLWILISEFEYGDDFGRICNFTSQLLKIRCTHHWCWNLGFLSYLLTEQIYCQIFQPNLKVWTKVHVLIWWILQPINVQERNWNGCDCWTGEYSAGCCSKLENKHSNLCRLRIICLPIIWTHCCNQAGWLKGYWQ